MLDSTPMTRDKFPFLTDDDLLELLHGKPKENVSVRLTTGARKILDEECKRMGGVRRGEALEMILREVRELRKKKR